MKFKILAAFLLVLSCAGFTGSPFSVFGKDGKKLPDSQVNSPEVNWELMSIQGHKQYSGVGLVDLFGGSGCTGTFLDTGAGAAGKAYVLSNGHCASENMPGQHDVLVDRPSDTGMNFRFNYFIDGGPSVRVVPITRIVYATMHGTDITLFELGATYGDLTSEGFVPYRIASQDPDKDTAVEMIGIPQTGVERAKRYLRRSTCTLSGRVNLREGGYEWFGSFLHACSSVGGSSGSPMISLATHEIVAINNTGVDDSAASQPECALDRPCQVNPDGTVTTDFVINYAERVTDIPSCFSTDGVFNLELAGCKLERPAR